MINLLNLRVKTKKYYKKGMLDVIKENIFELLNEQVNKETFSAYLYLDISNYYIDNGLDGLAIGLRFKHKKRWTMQCYLSNICKITVYLLN